MKIQFSERFCLNASGYYTDEQLITEIKRNLYEIFLLYSRLPYKEKKAEKICVRHTELTKIFNNFLQD